VQAAYSEPRQRQLFKNIVYVGALSVLLDMEYEVLEKLIASSTRASRSCWTRTSARWRWAATTAATHLAPDRTARAARRRRSASASSSTATAPRRSAACTAAPPVCAWYPITPSSSCAEAFQSYCQKLRVDKDTGRNLLRIVQAEDEIASIGMVVGAGWNGARAFTTTSGPACR
jgi:2-oxoglutarate ferredoxin oxidoreductase subunit alpha